MWDLTAQAALEQPNTNTALVIESVNELIDEHDHRMTAALINRVPSTIWLTLMVMALTAMLDAYGGDSLGLCG